MKKIIAALMILVIAAAMSGCERNVGDILRLNDTSSQSLQQDNGSNTMHFAAFMNNNMNPLTTDSYTIKSLMNHVYEPLFAVDTSLREIGVLAEKISINGNGTSVNIKLREGVFWHDNTEFTSDDVVYTVNLIISGKTNVKCSDMLRVAKDGKYAVNLTLARPVVNVPAMLDFPILKNNFSINTKDLQSPVGTGKFRYDGKISIDEFRFVPFENYHGTKADRDMIIKSVDSYDKEISLFRAGDTDAFYAYEDELMNAAKGKVKVINEPTGKMTYIGINFNNPIFWGVNTRRALGNVINKKLIVSTLVSARATASDYAANPSMWLFSEMNNVPEYSIDGAKSLMEADSWVMRGSHYERNVNGEKQAAVIRILVNEDETLRKAADMIADELTDFGIDTSVSEVDNAVFNSTVSTGYFDIFIAERDIGKNMDFSVLTAGSNAFTYVNDELSQLTSQLVLANDFNSKTELFGRCLDIIKNDVPFVPLYFKHSTTYCSEAYY